MIESVQFEGALHTSVSAMIDGINWAGIRLDVPSDLGGRINAWIAAGNVPADPDPPAPPPVPNSASKLGLKRAFAELGLWDAVKAYLAANPDLQEDWDLALEIRRTDPLTIGAITALSFTEEQVDQLLIRANALVA